MGGTLTVAALDQVLSITQKKWLSEEEDSTTFY